MEGGEYSLLAHKETSEISASTVGKRHDFAKGSGSEGINGVRTKDKVLLRERRRGRRREDVGLRRGLRVTTFGKHNNKLRRAANDDSRRDKTKFDTRILQTATRSLRPVRHGSSAH